MARRRKRKTWRNAAAYFVGSALLLGVLGISLWLLYLGHNVPSAACSGPPRSAAVILIDVSDTLPRPAQTHASNILINKLTDNRYKGSLVELRALSPDSPEGTLLFSGCHPGNGTEVSELDSSPDRAKATWSQAFLEPFSAAVAGALSSPTEADSSPLLETIQAISVGSLAKHPGESELMIVSDMLQHSDNISLYRQDVRTLYPLKSSAVWPRIRPLLDHTIVDYLVIARSDGPLLRDDLKHFWCIEWEAAAKNRAPTVGENCPNWTELIGLGD